MSERERRIEHQGLQRLVNGIPVNRDADFGVVFEKNSHLHQALTLLRVAPEDIDFYAGWDRHVGHCRLATGKVLAMTFAQGPAYAASAVERFARTGVTRLLRIGTCGAIRPDISSWDPIISIAAVRDETTTDAYLSKSFPSVADTEMTYGVRTFLDAEADDEQYRTHLGITLTNCARYREDPELLRTLSEHGRVANVDMESSAILLVSHVHGIKATSVGIAMDTPDAHGAHGNDPGLLKASRFLGATDHSAYARMMPRRIDACVRSAVRYFESLG